LKHTLIYIFFIVVGLSAHADEIDCSSVPTFMGKTICSDSQISDLNIQLAQSYRKSHALSDQPKFVLDEQKIWLENIKNKCHDSACLKQAYTSRIERLEGAANVELAKQPKKKANSLGQEMVKNYWDYAYVDTGKICDHFLSSYPSSVKCIEGHLYDVRYKVIYDFHGARREAYLGRVPEKNMPVDSDGYPILPNDTIKDSNKF
jgi:uncharacterized protein